METANKIIAHHRRIDVKLMLVALVACIVCAGTGYFVGSEKATAEIRFELLPC